MQSKMISVFSNLSGFPLKKPFGLARGIAAPLLSVASDF